jgi:hypothetical protein
MRISNIAERLSYPPILASSGRVTSWCERDWRSIDDSWMRRERRQEVGGRRRREGRTETMGPMMVEAEGRSMSRPDRTIPTVMSVEPEY